jgi:uncharacterized protein (DUF1800 family)
MVDPFMRFGLGRSMLRRVDAVDARGMIRHELSTAPAPLIAGEALRPSAACVRDHTVYMEDAVRRAREQAEKAAAEARDAALKAAEATPPGQPKPPIPPLLPYPGTPILRVETEARFRAARDADTGLLERLVWFWSNHFAVMRGRGLGADLASGAFEREAIRPFVLGRFVDMVQAVSRHQAMLTSLDAQISIGPRSRAGLRRGRGLNENLAREILELHTLGADGGYDQADVTALAMVLTGWTVVSPQDDDGELGETRFFEGRHEPGPKTILGVTYADAGARQLTRVLDDLARHPATARHIARKLAGHFVADDPPPALVARIADTFRATDGDLRAVALTLVDAPENQAPRPAKLRTPAEFVAAMLRCGVPLDANQTIVALRGLGNDLWNPPAPDGFSDRREALATPVGLKNRLELAGAWAGRLPPEADPDATLEAIIGERASEATRLAVRRAESRAQAFTILFMSPEFQQR